MDGCILDVAFNQNKENQSGTIYNSTPAGNYTANTNGGTMYKSMQFLYAGKKLKKAMFPSYFSLISLVNIITTLSLNVKIFEMVHGHELQQVFISTIHLTSWL